MYYSTFSAKDACDSADEDYYYENIENPQFRVESLTYQGYMLPPFQVFLIQPHSKLENWRTVEG